MDTGNYSLGENFRERIRRKIKRWVDNLRQLPGFERNAIIRAIMEIDLPDHNQATVLDMAIPLNRQK